MQVQVLIIATILSFSTLAREKITSVDFVQVLNDYHAEALFYYQNNWQRYRKQAQTKGYIESYQILQTEPNDKVPFHFMLITTYPDQQAFDKREEHFQPLIETGGGLKLLNDLKPGEFRKTLFYVDGKTLGTQSVKP